MGIEMNVKEIEGKSPIFKALSKKFSDDIAKRRGIDLKPPDGEKKVEPKSEKPVDKVKESEEERKRKLADGADGGREPKKAKEGDGDVREAERKRKASGESSENKDSKKVKSEANGDGGDKSKLLIGALLPRSAETDDKKKESKHKDEKKHKKDKDREKDRDKDKEASGGVEVTCQ